MALNIGCQMVLVKGKKPAVELGLKMSDMYDELEIKYKKSQRALWIARAMRAKDAQSPNSLYEYNAKHLKSNWNSLGCSATKVWEMKWQWVERKCREKAEEYA